MSKLCINLPPFAPDYSGAASALFDLGGIIVIHDASGCTGNYTGFDEPRWFGADSKVFCSGIRYMDAILGLDDSFIEKIKKAAKSLNPNFIAVLGSPVPMVIGTDFEGIAKELETITGIPAIGIPTTGLNYYGKGICDATIKLMDKFIKDEEFIKEPNSINILGTTPLDFYINENDKDFKELFVKNGINVLSTYYMGLTIDDMKKSVSASLNVVVSQSGIGPAEYMKERFSIPYVVVTPLCDGSLAVKKVKKALLGNFEEYVPSTENANTIILGEQIISNSIREYLNKELGYGNIVVGTLFDFSKSQMAEGDIVIKNEFELRKILNSGKYEKVIADPMVKQIIKDKNVKFYGFPHVALSSKVHWNETKRLMNDEMKDFLISLKEG